MSLFKSSGDRAPLELSAAVSRRNFGAFLWHSAFLALTMNFVDLNTVVPNMIVLAGGSLFSVGLMSTIMVGGNQVVQLFFAGFYMGRPRKKGYLILGIYLRVAALAALGFILIGIINAPGTAIIPVVIFLMALFSVSGAFAGIAYTDIMGKGIIADDRKRFLLIKEIVANSGVIVSALLVREILKRLEYPLSYGVLFLSAGAILLIATAGFWALKEPASKVREHASFGERTKEFVTVLREDIQLQRFLLIINLSGLSLVMIPFYTMLAKTTFKIGSATVGTYLLVLMTGSLVASLTMKGTAKSQRYRPVLYYFIIVSAFLPIIALILRASPRLYPIVFFLAGTAMSAYKVSQPGILLEISTNENRAAYVGISGAGNLLVLIFPVIAGFLLDRFGFVAVFLISSGLIASGMIFASKIQCTRLQPPESEGEEEER